MNRQELLVALAEVNTQYEMWCQEESHARQEMYEAESECEACEERMEFIQAQLDALGDEE